jgi:hypothetical protein
MSSDETYLESFIESLSTLPHEVRRNLDLIKDLDQTCRYVNSLIETLRNEFEGTSKLVSCTE